MMPLLPRNIKVRSLALVRPCLFFFPFVPTFLSSIFSCARYRLWDTHLVRRIPVPCSPHRVSPCFSRGIRFNDRSIAIYRPIGSITKIIFCIAFFTTDLCCLFDIFSQILRLILRPQRAPPEVHLQKSPVEKCYRQRH